MRRSLIHFRQIHLAVLLSAAVATAVLTGALLVGDSMRGSLRDLTLERLGRIDCALVTERFFREELAADLAAEPEFSALFEAAVPALLLQGTAADVAAQSRAARVQVHGIDARFETLFAQKPEQLAELLKKRPDQAFPPVVINESLQRELNAGLGDPLLLSFSKQSDIHREFVLGNRNSADIVQTLRLTLAKVIPDRGLGRFSLQPHQSLPLNAFVSLQVLQKALGQKERVNAIFAASRAPLSADLSTRTLKNALGRVWQLDDLGLALTQTLDCISLESAEFTLRPTIVEAATELATAISAPFMPIMTHLANSMEARGRIVPYSTIAAFDLPAGSERDNSLGTLKLKDGSAAPALADDEILLNEWAAAELGVEAGDEIEVSYFAFDPRAQLSTQRTRFRLRGIVALEGLGADPELTPEFPGVQEADDIFAWKTPFPIDLRLIRPQDEDYWDAFGAAPKAFVAASTGRRLWSSRFGNSTAVRIGPASGADVQSMRADFQQRLLEKIRPEAVGLAFQPVREQGLKAAAGATDFSMLFTGFSLFLIVSAALLVGLLFRLGVEQRAGEMGILLATGYPLAAVRRRFMLEGGALAAVGGLLGLGGAILYAGLLMKGLRSWWLGAVGTPFLSLHISVSSLLIGGFSALVVVLLTIGWSVRQCGKVPIRALLAGVTVTSEKKSGRLARIFAFAGPGLAGALVFLAFFSGATSSPGLFFGSGALLLVGGLACFSLWLRTGRLHTSRLPRVGFAPRMRLGIRNSARHPGRSMLCATLVGCACFVIVAVGANRRAEIGSGASRARESGTGGFALVAEAEIPLHQDLNSAEGRFELGFSAADAAIVEAARIVPFRLLPGEDVSCLNLYQPRRPRLLGVPDELIERGGFQFQQAAISPGEKENPWQLLQQELEPGVIPAIGDFNSVRWILHLGLGDELIVQDERGRDVRLRLVGLLQRSLFQSELLISETHFMQHFPARTGHSYFLLETEAKSAGRTASILEKRLSNYGFDATSADEKLAGYQAVENTYLSTFQTLGGLGLLLGTLGLGIVLLKNVGERSGELAALRACGFRRSTLTGMLVAENGFLLVAGMLLGSFAALVAVAPHLAAPGASVPWPSLLLTLLLVFLVGAMASAGAVFFALRRNLLTDLKKEQG